MVRGQSGDDFFFNVLLWFIVFCSFVFNIFSAIVQSFISGKLNTLFGISLVAQLGKNPPAMWETWVRSPAWEDPLEKGKAAHSSILAWRIPGTVESMGSQRIGHNWVTSLHSVFRFLYSSIKRSRMVSQKNNNLIFFFFFKEPLRTR